MQNQLIVEYQHNENSTKPVDLKNNGLCPGVKKLNIINNETNTDKEKVKRAMYMIPKEICQSTVDYTETILGESGVVIDRASGNDIMVSVKEITIQSVWTFTAIVKLKIEIPHINYTQIYTGEQGSGRPHNAVGYALHLAVMEFLNDPTFQKTIPAHADLRPGGCNYQGDCLPAYSIVHSSPGHR